MTSRASNNIPQSLREVWQSLDQASNKDQANRCDTMTTKSRAIVSRDTLTNGGWKLEDIDVPQPGEGELLVEMVASGICHTDVTVGSLPTGAVPFAFYPRVLGHEGSGYVRAVGPGVTVAAIGDPVLCSYIYCNECAVCKDGYLSHCLEFMKLNFEGIPSGFTSTQTPSEPLAGSFFGQSSFSNFSIVKSRAVVNAKALNLSKHELQLLAPLGCGIQTGAGTVLNTAHAKPSDTIAVLGLGGVGLSAVMGARLAGCRTIIGVDRVASRLALARELGCTHVVDTTDFPAPPAAESEEGAAAKPPSAEDDPIVAHVRSLTDGNAGVKLTVDTTGVPRLIEAGVAFTRNRGKYFQVGSPPFDFVPRGANAFEMMVSGKQFIGAFEGQSVATDFIPKMVRWYQEGKFPVDKMVRFLPAEEFGKALEQMHSGETIKPVITWS